MQLKCLALKLYLFFLESNEPATKISAGSRNFRNLWGMAQKGGLLIFEYPLTPVRSLTTLLIAVKRYALFQTKRQMMRSVTHLVGLYNKLLFFHFFFWTLDSASFLAASAAEEREDTCTRDCEGYQRRITKDVSSSIISTPPFL
jgi:hypothetical protein